MVAGVDGGAEPKAGSDARALASELTKQQAKRRPSLLNTNYYRNHTIKTLVKCGGQTGVIGLAYFPLSAGPSHPECTATLIPLPSPQSLLFHKWARSSQGGPYRKAAPLPIEDRDIVKRVQTRD